jgi:hypothetical protein
LHLAISLLIISVSDIQRQNGKVRKDRQKAVLAESRFKAKELITELFAG